MDESRRLGWVVLDMRTMKQAALLYAPNGENQGKWYPLSSPTFKGDKGNAIPEIRVFAALREVQFMPNAGGDASIRSSYAADGPEHGGRSPRSSQGGRFQSFPNNNGLGFPVNLGGSVASSGALVEGMGKSIDTADAPILGSVSDGGAGAVEADKGGTEVLHLFSLTTDVRSFKSTRRMPFPTASVVVRLTLPASLLEAVELGGRTHAAVATPVRTNPPVTVSRASEVTLQNGVGTVDFGAGVMNLATALAAGPRLTAEVWHKDKYTADQLLGTATVSLAPLLQEPMVDGYAPVLANIIPGSDRNPRSAALLEPEAVKVGELRMVLSLAEKGPLPMWATKMSAYDRFPLSHSHEEPTKPVRLSVGSRDFSSGGDDGARGSRPGSLRASLERVTATTAGTQLRVSLNGGERGRAEGGGSGAAGLRSSLLGTASLAKTSKQETMWGVTGVATAETKSSALTSATAMIATTAQVDSAPAANPATAAAMAAGVADSIASMDGSLRKGREYAVAWELEVWKQAQESKWTSQMRAREAERMTTLEREWRRREAQREAEHHRAKEENTALEKRLSTAIAVIEERERKLIAAEESLSVRREAERREMAQRMSEAQHAVRRLQQECEHQLEMEKGRSADIERQKAVLEERIDEANARAAAVERAFHGYKRAHLESSEATLHAEIARLQQQRVDAEQAAMDAVKSRDRFKTQIQKMAKQVVALERERTYLRAALAHGNSSGTTAAHVPAVASAKPAPSGTDFMADLFGEDALDAASAPASGTGVGSGAGLLVAAPAVEHAGVEDTFLRDFRESIAALEAEARAAEQQSASAIMAVLSPTYHEPEHRHEQQLKQQQEQQEQQEKEQRQPSDDGHLKVVGTSVPMNPARSPARSPQRQPVRSPPPQQLASAPSPQSGQRQALEQLRMRRQMARQQERTSPLKRKPPTAAAASSGGSGHGVLGGAEHVNVAWSIESNDGLKALFASAKDYEEEMAVQKAEAATEAELNESTAASTEAPVTDATAKTDRSVEGGDAGAITETASETTAGTTAPMTATTKTSEEMVTSVGTVSSASPCSDTNVQKPSISASSLAEKRALEKEVRRLVAERAELMGTGAYSSSDRVIVLIDEKITELTTRVARG